MHRLSVLYDPERQRIFQSSVEGGVTTNTVYVGGNYEKITTGSVIEHKHYIFAGDERIAVHTQRGAVASVNYLHTDHLSSVDAISNAQGQVIERLSYDPHGKRRHANGYNDMSNLLTSQITTRGFTGHEHLDGVDLIHMNGRVYDPQLGRFLTADPTVQYPESTQNYNRYSYVDNNPLSFTDPSGYGILKKLFRAIRGIFRAIRQNFRSILAIGVAIVLTPYLTPAGAGFVSGLISGGDLKSGIIGALTAGAFQGVGNLVQGGVLNGVQGLVAKGVVGGVSSLAQGGKFAAGFFSGAVGGPAGAFGEGLGGTIGGAIASAVAGGIASVLGGGKFENGAITGSFAYLFNYAIHPAQPGGIEDTFRELGRSVARGLKSFALGLRALTVVGAASLLRGDTPRYDKIVIGEGMEARVIPYAKSIGAEYYDPPKMPQSLWLEANRAYINEVMDQDYQIIDIGPQVGRANYPEPTSPYYKVELNEINSRNYPRYSRVDPGF